MIRSCLTLLFSYCCACFILLCSVAMASSAIPAPSKLTIVVDNFPPYLNQHNPEQGVLSQLAQAAFSSQGITTELQFKPWNAIPELVKNADHVGLMWFKTADLERDWLFSEPVMHLRQMAIITTALTDRPTRLDQLQQLRVGVTQGHVYGARFSQLKTSLALTEALSDYLTLKNLLMGKVDVVLMDPIVAHQLLQKMPASQHALVYLPDLILTDQPTYLVCSRNYLPCHQTIQQFNLGLALQQSNGLERRLFGFGVTSLP